MRKESDDKIYLTTSDIIQYVAQEFNIKYSPSSMRDFLHRASDVEVLFIDAVHPEHNTMAAYG